MDESLISYLIPDLGSAVEVSSSTVITFQPGESEKTVIFELLDDDRSEGSEAFTFTLSNAEGTSVFMPSAMNVSIKDDEPIEHSLVTFSDAQYTAENGAVSVTVERTGAEYSLVTARVRAVETGSAEQGQNFAQTDVELAFEPYSTEAELTIPVKGDPGHETIFTLELYDLKGGEDGENMTASAVIPASPAVVSSDGKEEPAASLMGDEQVKIPGFGVETYTLQEAGNDTYKIMDTSKKPWQEVGIYVKPTNAHMTGWTNYGDSCSTWSNSWDGDGNCRTLKWYSRLSWRQGGTKYVTRLQNSQNYQQIFLDYSTNTSYSSNKHGFSFNVWGPDNRTITTRKYEIGGKNGRDVRGAQVMYTDALDKKDGKLVEQHSGKLIAPYWNNDPTKNYTTLTLYAEKTSHGCIEPDMNGYGYLAMYRQYRLSVEQPDVQKYIDIGSNGEAVVAERRPANVYLAQGHNVRYPYQQIGITETALNPGDPIGGTLTGYYIKPAGTNGDGYFYKTKSGIIDLNDGMMQALDEYARSNWNKNESVMKKDGGVYYMDLTIKPVYEKTFVTVKVTPSADGKFNWGCLDPENTAEIDRIAVEIGRMMIKSVKKYDRVDWDTMKIIYKTETEKVTSIKVDTTNGTISGLFAVGDRLNLDATPMEDCFYTACHYEGFKNPGDTTATVNQELNQHSQMTDWKALTVVYSRTELSPRFTRDGNRIEVRFENGADRYFYLTALASEEEKGDKFADKQVLRIDDSLTEDNVTPVLGHAYTFNAAPTATNDSSIRPVFTLADGTQVKGWAVDVIAKYTASQNVITVGWEKYDPGALRYYGLEGLVRYETVTVRQSSQGLKNEPAREVLVTVGGEAIPYYTKNKTLGYTVLRQSASTDTDGHFVINGVRALPGDRISILVSDNGVVQAEYRYLPENAPEESRTFAEQQANHGNRTNDIVQHTEKCLVADITADPDDRDVTPKPIRLPVVTGYTPYVTDVRFSLTDHVADGRNNTVPIYAGDYVNLEADVSIPKLGDKDAEIKAVRFVIYDKDGKVKDTYETTRKTASGGEALNTWQISVPYTPPQDWPYQALEDGDRVYVQVVGPDRSVVNTVTDDKGNPVQEVKSVETPYALLNTGLSFFTPVEDVVQQSYNAELDKPQTADLIGSLAGKVDTGQMTWNKEYDDPNNMATSNYIQYFGIAMGVNNDGFGRKGGQFENKSWNKMNELMKGGKAEEAAEKTFNEKWEEKNNSQEYQESATRTTAFRNIQDRVTSGDISQQKADQLKADWDKGQQKEFMNGEKKNSLTAFAEDKQQIGGEIKVVCAWQWVYNEELNTHEEWGYAFSLTFTGYVSRTFYTVYVIPFYLNIDAKLAYNYEGGGAEPAQKVYAQDFARQNELSEYDNSDYGWHTITVDGKIAVGAGIYGIVGARGIVKFAFAGTVAQADGWDPDGGVSFQLGGGFGVDLFVTSVNMEFSIPAWTTGYYDRKPVRKEKLDGNASLQGADDWAQMPSVTSSGLTLKPFDPGSETYNAIEDKSASLQSILVPKREETIIDGSMQYVRPQAVALDSDTFLVFFLQNKAGTVDDSGQARSQANAAALVYAVANIDEENRINWDHETGTVIVDNDGLADTTPDVLRMGDSVYVAWATGDSSGVDTASGVKEALSATSVKLQKLDIQGNTVEKNGEAVTVAGDKFQNTNPQLVEEDGKLAVYYFKQDLSEVKTTEDLVNFTGNYNTYARRLYNEDLKPQPQINNGARGAVTVDADEELLIQLQEDVMTADFNALSYTSESGKAYRLAAYTVDKDGKVDTGDDIQIWLQVQNMTDGRNYYPVLLDEGENANLQINRVRIKTQTEEGGKETVTEDVFLTWVSDSTCFNTLSFNDLFQGLRDEEGTQAALESLTPEEAVSPGWAALAYQRAGGDPEKQFTLRALSQGEPIFNTRDFGTIMPVENGETAKNGDSLPKYVLITGDDGNTYLAWTASNGVAGNMGNELMMSSYYSFNKDLRHDLSYAEALWKDYDQKMAEYQKKAEAGDETAEMPAVPRMERPEPIPFEGWSDPVQVTDFRLTMTEKDREVYDSLMGKTHTEKESKTLSEINEKYSRAIDELAVMVSRDSGAMMLANTFLQGYDAANNRYEEKAYKLSAIRCVPDTSLEIESMEISDTDPMPGDEVSLTWELANNGLLPATDYRIRITAAADGGGAEEIFNLSEIEPAQAVYPGGSMGHTLTWTAPGYDETLTLTIEVTEQNPATGGTDFETTNRETLTLTRHHGLTLGAAYGYPAIDYAERAILNSADTSYLYQNDTEQLDREYQALLDHYGDAAELLTVYNNTTEPDYNGAHRYFYVFVPTVNYGRNILTDLTFLVTNEDTGRKMGIANVEYLDTDESRIIPVLAPIRLSEFGELGVVNARVTVLDKNGNELDTIPVTLQSPDNIRLETTATGENADKLTVLQDISAAQLMYQTFFGDEVIGTEDWKDLASDDPADCAKRIDLKVGQTIQLTATAFPYDTLKTAEFNDTSDMFDQTRETISVTGNGKVTAIAPGASLLYAVDGSEKADALVELAGSVGQEIGPGMVDDISSQILFNQILVVVTEGGGGSGGGSSGGRGSSPVVNPVNVPSSDSSILHGTALSSAAKAKAGDKVTITVTPDEGYQVSGLSVKDANGNSVAVTDNGDGTYSFTMPAAAVNVLPSFTKIGEHADSADCPKDASCPISKFSDASPTAWYHDGVHWALDKGIMKGIADNLFAPNDATTRAMVVTMLWRLEGTPAVNSPASFRDVASGEWYTDGVNWAAANGIVTGYDAEAFGPMDPVTREQLVTILHRYAAYKGKAVSPDANILDYDDAFEISSWAVDSFRWAVQEGVIQGVGNNRLAPKEDATRAQIATMFMRFSEEMS